MSAPTPLILLPGLLCDAALWAPQARALAGMAEILVPSLMEDDAIAGMAARVLAEAPPRFALCGLSMGGYVAMEIVRTAPERVERLALIDTSARPDTAEQKQRRRGLIELAQKGRFKGVTPRLLPLLLAPANLADEAIAGTVMAMAERVGKEAYIRQQRAIIGRPDSRLRLPLVRCPTLVLVGGEDALTPPPVAEEMAALIPGATLHVIEGAGHLAPLERPDEVTKHLARWLAGSAKEEPD